MNMIINNNVKQTLQFSFLKSVDIKLMNRFNIGLLNIKFDNTKLFCRSKKKFYSRIIMCTTYDGEHL